MLPTQRQYKTTTIGANLNSFDIVAEKGEGFVVATPDEDGHCGLSIVDQDDMPASEPGTGSREQALARLILDCRSCDDDGFARLLSDGLDLLGRTEVDIVKMFAVRLERAERWTFGSEIPHPQMKAGLLQWIVKLAEMEIG